MKEFVKSIKELGIKGIIAWLKNLFLAISMLEFISVFVYLLIAYGAISKMLLIWIPIIGIFIASIDTALSNNEEIEDEEEEET